MALDPQAEAALAAAIARVEAKVDVALTQTQAKLEELAHRIAELVVGGQDREVRLRRLELEQAALRAVVDRTPRWPAYLGAVAAVVSAGLAFFAVIYVRGGA